MEKTLNQLMKELEIIAQEHRQINEFFQGDFLDAISRDSAQYPLMVATLQPGGMAEGYVRVNVVLTICDKYNQQEYRQMNEVHSDCLSICNDIKTTMLQYRWTEFSDLLSEIASDPFINRGQDMVAGWTMNIAFTIYDNEDWCAIPYDDYDFENGYTPPPAASCADATVENSDASYSQSVLSGGTLVLPDITVTDSDGSSFSSPSVKNITCTPQVKDLFLKGIFASGSDTMETLTIDADNAGTFTSITDDGASGDITLSVNGGGFLAFSSPLTLAVSDTLVVKRTVTTASGWFKLSGTYV